MSYGIKLKVWGEYAAFNRPEMKVERVSYEIMTPSAARGILEAIYWKPEMRWAIDRIRVLAPIRFTSVRRNEIGAKIPARSIEQAMRNGSGKLGLAVDTDRQQRASQILRDVCYGIEAHLDVRVNEEQSTEASGPRETKPEAKHLDSFRRRARKGQFFHHPYLGCREFPAHFKLVDSFPDCPPELRGELDLGLMLQDVHFVPDEAGMVVESNRGRRLRATPAFLRALVRDGVLTVPPLEANGG